MNNEDVKIVIKQKGTIPVYTSTKVGTGEIFHDNTLEGKGTSVDPLKVSESIISKIDTFVFDMGIASDTWTITHNLNKHPAVTVVDSAGTMQIPNEISYDNANQITITFLGSFAGKAFLN